MARFFDLDDANETLPELRTILETLRDERTQLIALRDEFARQTAPETAPGDATAGGTRQSRRGALAGFASGCRA